jgi:arsenical pump membrane protein
VWLVAIAAALLALVTGWLPVETAGESLARVAPVLVFVVAVSVIAELADSAGVFDAAAGRAAALGRGSVRRLWLLLVLVGTVATILLSLDTTAVLLTPVVLALARRLGLPVVPFAMTTVWLANTASLLLPVSNLTNLLAVQQLGLGAFGYAARMWAPAVVAVGVSVAVLALRYRRDLRGRYALPAGRPAPDRVLFRVSTAVCVAIGPLVVVGVPAVWVAVLGATTLGLMFLLRRKEELRLALVPWQLVLVVAGLFLVVAGAQPHGLGDLARDALGSGGGLPDLLRVGGVGGASANLVNNLPAYFGLEPATGGGDRLLALLIGVNVAPLVLPWGSLATLLWRDRARSAGAAVPWREFVTIGLIGAPLLVLASVTALWLTG